MYVKVLYVLLFFESGRGVLSQFLARTGRRVPGARVIMKTHNIGTPVYNAMKS